MRTKKIIALFMAHCLFALAFVACGNNPSNKDGEKGATESMGENNTTGDVFEKYNLVYADGITYDVENAFSKFSAQLSKLTGVRKEIKSDAEVAANDNEYEILLGDTNRAQSAEEKAKLNGEGFSITENGNKIVIVATNSMILEDAVTYFMANVSKGSDGKYEYPMNYTNSTYQALDLVSDGKAKYTLVFTDFYNNINKHTDKARDEFGFTRTRVKTLASNLEKLTGVSFSYYPENQAPVDKNKIIVGKPNGDTIDYFDYHESGVYLKDGNIYIYGHNHEGIDFAIKNFLSRVNKYNKLESSKYSILCQAEGYKFSNSDVKYDIPLPKNVQYEGAYTAANNGIYFVYENCSLDVFDAYCTDLTAAGFTQYFQRKASTNSFAGFYKGEEAAWIYYISDRKELRVVFEPYQPLPKIEIEGDKVQDAYITQMGSGYKYNSGGMAYIIGLEDGRYIVIDGGVASSENIVAKRYYDYMKDNNKHPSGDIVIAAWIITHGHNDHYGTFEQFGSVYGSIVKCKYIIHNLPTELSLWGAGNVSTAYLDHNYTKKDGNFKGASSYTVHTGYAATVGGVYLEFMSTYEDLYNNNDLVKYTTDPSTPNSLDEMNDTSVTFRFTFNKGKSDETKVFFLGDNYFTHGERLASMWAADYMKSDVVQMAHHGYNNGVTNGQIRSKGDVSLPLKSSTYTEISAEYGFVPAPSSRISDTSQPISIMMKANKKLTIKNLYSQDVNGEVADTTMNFNGGVNVKVTIVV